MHALSCALTTRKSNTKQHVNKTHCMCAERSVMLWVLRSPSWVRLARGWASSVVPLWGGGGSRPLPSSAGACRAPGVFVCCGCAVRFLSDLARCFPQDEGPDEGRARGGSGKVSGGRLGYVRGGLLVGRPCVGSVGSAALCAPPGRQATVVVRRPPRWWGLRASLLVAQGAPRLPVARCDPS